MSGSATAVCSTIGSGSANRPVSSRISVTAISSTPSAPATSGWLTPTTPMSASPCHVPLRPSVFVHASRTTSGGHSFSRKPRTASRIASCSSENANLTRSPPGEPEYALGNHVALDLVRARVDGSRQRELPSLHPRGVVAVDQLGAGTEQAQGGLVEAHVELRPEDFHEA